MELAGYLAAAFIGISLGLIGGGGSILTVPVMVYLFSISPTTATTYSLFIVGLTSMVGGIGNLLQKSADLKTAAIFSVPSIVAVYISRRWVMPAIPDTLLVWGDWELTRDIAIMMFFALIMLAAAVSMILDKKPENCKEGCNYNYPMIFLEGVVVGFLTGMVGAGGGFLIIPALVLFANLPMKTAVGTSLLIIAAKSLIGFLGDLGSGIIPDFSFLLLITAIAIGGIFLGVYFTKFINGKKLKSLFGWFVLLMGLIILFKEVS